MSTVVEVPIRQKNGKRFADVEVHRILGGPGLLEDIYEEALCYELSLRSVPVRRQVGVPVIYKGNELRKRLVLDILVGERVIVEVKAVEQYNVIFDAQLLTYLRLSDRKLGLVINFGESVVKDGVHRVVNNL